MVRLAFLMVPLIALAGCKTENKAFCDTHPGMDGCPDSDGSVGASCKATPDCTNPSLPVCNTDKGMCTQCFGTARGACTGVTPRCAVDTCVACADDTQDCGPGGLCLASGACAAAASILHARSNGSADPGCGSTSTPCTLEQALLNAMATPSKSVIKLDDAGTYTPTASNFVVDANVTIDMRAGAVLQKINNGPVLEIRTNRTVTLLGGTIEGATGSNGDGILCNGQATLTIDGTTVRMTERSGINTTSGCHLTVTRANISNTSLGSSTPVAGIADGGDSITISRSSIVANRGGGITVNSGTFVIIGNAFMNNGDNTNSLAGGIAISAPVSSMNRLDFNTIANNKVRDGGKGGGIDCDAGTDFTGRYNILWNNKTNTVGTVSSQISGVCKYDYSDIGPAGVPTISDGGHNLNKDPLLVNESSDPHLQMNSPAIGAADPMADVTGIAAKDIDGDARVARPGKGADIGADQYTGP